MPTRTIVVTSSEVGRPVVAVLKAHLKLSWSQARHLVEKRCVRQGPRLCKDPQSRVRAGQKLRVRLADSPVAAVAGLPGPQKTRPKPGPQPTVRYIDDQIVVVDKPAGLTTMRHAHEAAEFGQRGRRYLPATLADLLPPLLASKGHGRGKVIAVHRLDRDTSGLVVFARNADAARHLGAQFRDHSTDRTYLAVVRGKARSERIESSLISDRGDGRRGSNQKSDAGQGHRAITHVELIEELGEFTLVECRLETGRTHQVRIHLGERGTPICGERIYDRPLHGAPVSDGSGAKRLALHAASLELIHPTTGKQMRWASAMPPELEQLVKRLRNVKSRQR
jgi:23S rRNA pseudouridine1911/1915/1917 synthase